MFLPRINSLLFLLSFLSFTVCGQTGTDIENSNWEVWETSIPVSADINVGIVESSVLDKIDPFHLYVYLPTIPEMDVCIEVRSKDGRYRAERVIKKESLKKGTNKINWPTKYGDNLDKFSSSDITILSRVTDSCDEDPEYLVASSWSDSFSSDKITLYLRTKLKSFVEVYDKNGDFIKEVLCQNLVDEPLIAYDCKCDIPKELVSDGQELTIVKRVRKNSRIKFKRYDLPLRF